MISGTNRGTRAGVINSCQCVYSTANIASVIGTSPYRNEQVLIVFPDSNLRRSPNLEEVSVPKLQIALLSVADSPKMWLYFLPGHSCRPSVTSQYCSLHAWERGIGRITVFLVESLGLTCASVTLMSIVHSPKMWMHVLLPWSLLSSIGRLSILFPACLGEGHRGGNRLCLAESLGLACASGLPLSVVDSPKIWL